MSDREEQAYLRGMRQPWARLAAEAARELGYAGPNPESMAANLIAEREAALEALRSVCNAYGDNDWSPNLHLADIIEKHLGRALDDAARKRGEKGR